MTIDEQIRAAKERTLRAFQSISEFELREAQTDLQEFYADNMQSATKTNYKQTKSGKLRSLPNKTDKLYVLYGNLMRSLQPKQRGNISEIEKSNSAVKLSIGIDLAQVPYARIHEFGGSTGAGGRVKMPARPYFFPAIKQYAALRYNERVARIVDKLITVWDQA